MTLQRRLILAVLIAAPFAWLLTLGVTYWRAQHEINELYDTDMVRLAQHMRALLPLLDDRRLGAPDTVENVPLGNLGDAGLADLAVSAWAPDGRQLHVDPDGDRLPASSGLDGFSATAIDGVPWRLYYLENASNGWRVAVGQRLGEREELVESYLIGQAFPWLFGLPVLLALLIWAVRHALRPVRDLSHQIAQRDPEDPIPLDASAAPGELQPLVHAMNQLLARVAGAIEHERRLTADAAHELRTPLAALQSQWDVAQRATDPAERAQAQANMEAGIERLNRLVSQLLAMARLESAVQSGFGDEVHWPHIAQEALSDSLALARRKDVDVEMHWPAPGVAPLPLVGNEYLLGLMLRNLLDNAVRYGPAGGVVALRFSADAIAVEDQGPGVEASAIGRLGDRFFRIAGQQESGSGLGLSIAHRIAHLHGLQVQFENRQADGRVIGFSAAIRRAASSPRRTIAPLDEGSVRR
ncbi:MAG: ATP-binding protein [Achromobacter sp.]|jgi:two-component system sensor histidine kinase QseC